MPDLPKVRLTDAFAAKATLPPGKRDHVYWDDDVTGFGLRVRSASRTYIVFYRPAGAGRSTAAKRFKIGTPSILTATQARQLAKTTLGLVAAGRDPAKERAEEKRRARSTLADLLDRYELDLSDREYVDLKGTMSTLRRNLHPLRNRDVKSISGSEIVEIRSKLAAEGLPGASKNFFSRCRAFFSWCVSDQKVIEANPIYAHRNEKRTRAAKIAEEEYGRALSGDELLSVWVATRPDLPYDETTSAFGAYLRFLILTGCRRTEASKVARSMIRQGKGGDILVIPKQITKSGRDHNLPITPAIAEIISPRGRTNDLLFPSWRTGALMSGWAKMLKPIVQLSRVDFDLHDLRRTFRTGLSQLGIDDDVAEVCVNHSRKGLEKIYNRDSAGSEMRQAFEAWSTYVQGLIRRHERDIFEASFRRMSQSKPSAPPPGQTRPRFSELAELSRLSEEDAVGADD